MTIEPIQEYNAYYQEEPTYGPMLGWTAGLVSGMVATQATLALASKLMESEEKN